MREIYFDNSATTSVCKEACDKMYDMMINNYGNASSLHIKGMLAENELTSARKIIADMLSVDKDEIYFCSGGTEANNLAIFGTADVKKRLGKKIVTTAFEHSSVMECMAQLEKKGFEVTYIKPDDKGNLSPEKIINAIDKDTILVSMMLVNNEVGSIVPIDVASKVIAHKKLQAYMHCDAVQAFGKMPVKPKKLGVDLLTISSHKVHGPKGVGALFIRKGVRVSPIIFGGEQQGKVRPGTENTSAIAGFGEAVKQIPSDFHQSHMNMLHKVCMDMLTKTDGIVINSPCNAVKNIINFSVPGIRSETMLHHLSLNGIYVSSGSACAKGKASYVLEAMGLKREISDSAIRLSFSELNTVEEIEIFYDVLVQGIQTLARAK